MKEIYLGLQARIEQANVGIKTYDWWNGQYEKPADHKAYARPAVFVEFMPMAALSKTRRRKMVPVDLRLHLVTELRSDTSKGSRSQDTALSYLDLVDALYKAIEGHNYKVEEPAGSGNYRQVYNTVTHTSTETDHSYDNVVVTILTFHTLAMNHSAEVAMVPPPAGVKVTVTQL